MKKLLLSAALVLGMMTLTTGCTGHGMGAKKCGASGKCNKGKCGSDKSADKKCGGDKAEKASDKKCGGDKTTDKKCGSN